MASHGESPVVLKWFPTNLFGQCCLHIFQDIAWSDIRKRCATCWFQQNGAAVHAATPVHAGLSGHQAAETSARRLTDRPGPVRSLHLCLLGNRLCSTTLCEVRKCAQSFLQQLIGAVKELHGGHHGLWGCHVLRFPYSQTRRFKIQEAAVETDPKEVKRCCVI